MKVMVGVDDSAESRHAVDTAFEYFGSDASYLIVSVGERMPMYSASFPGGSAMSSINLSKLFDAAAKNALRKAVEASSHLPKAAEVAAVAGHTGRALCDAAVDNAVGVIVIGSHDKSAWERLLHPSVGRYLIDHAPCPVLVVR